MNDTEKLLPVISDEESQSYDAKCAELQTKYNASKVYCCVQFREETNERIISYITEPNYTSKLVLMDKANDIGMHQAADELRVMCQLIDESHPLTYGVTPECDQYKLGVAQFCIGVIKISMNQFKKK